MNRKGRAGATASAWSVLIYAPFTAVVMKEQEGVGLIMACRLETVVVAAGGHHFGLGGPAIPRCELFQGRYVYEFRFLQAQLVTHFEQYSPQFGELPDVVEVLVHIHILGHYFTDAMQDNESAQRIPESFVLLSAVAGESFREVPRPRAVKGIIARRGGYIQSE